ncbi:MAG: hypothetical protein FWC32_04265 [Firmicutes bacterium]|nr:hypothetical protein [Bacillota bacterium]
MTVVDNALEYGIMRGHLKSMLGLYFNKGYALLSLGKSEEALSYLVLAYYGFLIYENHGKNEELGMIRGFIKEKYNIILS